jgi:hypothetical protein
MSRTHSKRHQRGIAQPLESRVIPFRNSRHGKPQTQRAFKDVEVYVVPGTPGAKRSVEPADSSITYPSGTVLLDGLVVVHKLVMQVTSQVPTKPDSERTMKVAAGPTGTYGQKNTGGASAGRKSAKPAK